MPAKTFDEAVPLIKKFTKRPTNDEILYVYSLYKQVTVGDINISQPGFLDIEGRSKWNAWKERKGMKKEIAMEKYVDFVNELEKKYL